MKSIIIQWHSLAITKVADGIETANVSAHTTIINVVLYAGLAPV
jgi:hypothetical protein